MKVYDYVNIQGKGISNRDKTNSYQGLREKLYFRGQQIEIEK